MIFRSPIDSLDISRVLKSMAGFRSAQGTPKGRACHGDCGTAGDAMGTYPLCNWLHNHGKTIGKWWEKWQVMETMMSNPEQLHVLMGQLSRFLW